MGLEKLTPKAAVREGLLALSDEKYGDFMAKLTPGIPRETMIGVRIPELRKLANRIQKTMNVDEFLAELPHEYFEENLIHGMFISNISDYDKCIEMLDAFLPFVDNWAVCDTMKPKAFKKNIDRLFCDARRWTKSKETYAIRFGIGMLMAFFLNESFSPEVNKIVAQVSSSEYYVNMMRAWHFATALSKQYEATIPYLENRTLDKFTHNKTIQKAIESYRISNEQKIYLRTLKV